MGKRPWVYLLLLLVCQVCIAQDSIYGSQTNKFRNIEIKNGLQFAIMPSWKFSAIPLTLNVVYMQSIKNHLSFISYSDFYSNRINGRLYDFNYRHWIESIGIGGSFSAGVVSQNVFLLAGSRLYYSRLNIYDDQVNTVMVTKRWTPDLGILYNVNISKRRLYFCCQLYLSILPIKNFLENKQAISFGVGYKLYNNKKQKT